MMLRVLSCTTLYPNAHQLRHGIFVGHQMRQMRLHTDIDIKVLAPVPWFPASGSLFGRYGIYAQVRATEQRHGITVWHPRYLVITKIGRSSAPLLLAAGMLRAIRRIRDGGFDFDLLDAHYFYPDGVAAALVGQLLNKSVVITALGSDINLIGEYALPRA